MNLGNADDAITALETKNRKFLCDVPNVDSLCADNIPSNQSGASSAHMQRRRMMKARRTDYF